MWPFSRKTEQRAGNWLAFDDLLRGQMTSSGVTISEANAILHPAVYRCVDLIAQTIAAFPVDCLKRAGDVRSPYPAPLWMRQPNDYQDFAALVAETQASCELYDSAFLLKATGDNGQLLGLSVLDPNSVEVKWADLGSGPRRVMFIVQQENGRLPLTDTEVLWIKAGLPLPGQVRGVSPVTALRETIGVGLAARQFGANFYGTGATLSGVIEVPGNMPQEAADRLRASFQKKHGGVSKSHAIGILSGGAKWVPISVKPDESQHLETQKHTDGVIAAAFGVPAEYVNPSAVEGAKGYVTGVYMRQMLWYQTGLFPRIVRLERAFSGVLPRPAYLKFNVNAWLRMDPEQRVAFYAAGQAGEWLTRNEIRAWEDMNPLPDADEPLHSVQWQQDALPVDEPAPDEEPTDEVAS